MTGKEKIAAFIQEIDKAHQELITGNKVRIYSGGLPGTLEEQKQIFDILVNDKQAIRYSQSDVYKSEDDIDYETLIHIKEESIMDGVMERQMIEELMASQWYDIEVLDHFAALRETVEAQEQEQQKNETTKPFPNNGHILVSLAPNQYDKSKGIIYLDPLHKIIISKLGTAKSKDGKKIFECWVLECVFKTVNTMRDGTTFSKVLGLATHKIDATEIRKVRNAVDAINKKVTDNRGPEKLLKIQKGRIFINNSYL